MEGKKSFVLYADMIDIVNDLTDEQAGKLVKTISDYVNDRNPEPDDTIVKIAFKPIKNQLKRDLNKWESIREKRSEAGKKGGRPKKDEKANKPNAFFDNQTKAKKAVTVNVNDNVNVTDNVNVNENSFCTVANAFQIFNSNNLSGRYFNKLKEAFGLNEDQIQGEFEKWKTLNEDVEFENHRHLKNSFRNWVSKFDPKKEKTKPTKEKIDWENI